jgi:DNA-binding NarL/FixJ family response regulator
VTPNRWRVLVADDHAPTREDVRIAIEDDSRFAVVGEVADSFGAIEVAIREQPDLCILDVHMPGSGVRAAWEIGARLPECKIVMLTVSLDDRDLFGSLQAGAVGYLAKDMDLSRLAASLADVMEGRGALPRALLPRLMDSFRDRTARRRTIVSDERRLTSREWQVLDLMHQGLTTREIARRLVLSPVTVRTHIHSITKKMGAADRRDVLRDLNEG